MYKKFLNTIILVFAFLFFNMSFNSFNVKAEDGMPESAFAKAGYGDKKGYWAIANYGADYISGDTITIDIQKEAIADQDVNFILIMESNIQNNSPTYYERNVDGSFASRLTYTLKNKTYGDKEIVIFLLSDLKFNPTESLIIDKIKVGVTKKRSLAELTSSDVQVTPEVDPTIITPNPYDLYVTLNIPDGKGVLDDYVLKNVKYRRKNDEDTSYYNSFEYDLNAYNFTIYRKGVYEIIVEDYFGETLTVEYEVTNLVDPDIYIETIQERTGLTNQNYAIQVIVKYVDSDYILRSEELTYIDVYFKGEKLEQEVLSDLTFETIGNGEYTIKAKTKLTGSEAEFVIAIDNIDMEDPYAESLKKIVVYTEHVNYFEPVNEIYVYDNITDSEWIIENGITLTYHTIEVDSDGNPRLDNNGRFKKAGIFTGDCYEYLYSVRHLIVEYKVVDEAGNDTIVTSDVEAIDDTSPTIEKTENRMFLEINDDYPTKEELEEAYGIKVNDNNYYGKISYTFNFDELPVDNNGKMNKLGLYNIYVSAIDAAGNASDYVILTAEVRQRTIEVEAGAIDADGNIIPESLYIVYGDKDPEDIKIPYHCVRSDGKNVPCSEELLEGDAILGELYVLNARYTDIYEIHYDSIRIPSALYYLEYGDIDEFEIKIRTIKIKAIHVEKTYLDPDPELTYAIDRSVCDVNNENYLPHYRCDLIPGDYFIGNLERDMSSPSEDVLYDEDGNVLPRKITIGTLDVYELYDGGVKNYAIDFVDGEFTIYPKEVVAYIARHTKIYGEKDPSKYMLSRCEGRYPIREATPSECMDLAGITLYRAVDGERVVADANGNYYDYYEIHGRWDNLNYEVEFVNSYLTILRRDIEISVVGDLDEFDSPTGKYTIYYEDELPDIKVYDSSTTPSSGLAHNETLTELVKDSFYYGQADIYLDDENVLIDYVTGIGLYPIRKGSIIIVDSYGDDAEYNYNITFNEGILEVIKKHIWIKIIKDLSKIYGDNDKLFTEENLSSYGNHIILEENNRYIIEIKQSQVPGEEPFIPRDRDDMKYHLIREYGEDVGFYPIVIDDLEGCENYEVHMFEDYLYEIEQRGMGIYIYDDNVIYKNINPLFTYDEDTAKASLKFDDYLDGVPEVEPYEHVGVYKIGLGTIKVLDPYRDDLDVSYNYDFNIREGNLTVNQREITVVAKNGQRKEYGDFDPDVFEFEVYHNGILEELPEEQYEGKLTRIKGEIPDRYYAINNELEGRNKDIDPNDYPLRIHTFVNKYGYSVEDYLIVGWDFGEGFKIEKRNIKITARDVTAMYGNPYMEKVVYDVEGGLANNPSLFIDGIQIKDIIIGSLKIIGEVDGVGTYEISTQDLKIVRKDNQEDDVTNKYYNCTFDDGLLNILKREIFITPTAGQSKLYGELDPVLTYTYNFADLLLPTDKFVGALKRESVFVDGVEIREDARSDYLITKGTLKVETASGKDNYDIKLTPTTTTFTIRQRILNAVANDLNIYYGDPFTLTYRIEGDGLATENGFNDKIEGELNLDKEYTGVGVYRIEGKNLTVTNLRNYVYTFSPGILIVNKRNILITVNPSSLSKIYGEKDPEFKFTSDAPYVDLTDLKIVRVPGESAQKYKVYIDREHSFLDEKNYHVELVEETYFEIIARNIIVEAVSTGRLYTKNTENLKEVLTYTYTGILIGNDTFWGALEREPGNEVGVYKIIQGSLTLGNNYNIIYVPGTYTISYAEFTDIIIYPIKETEKEVMLYAKFNDGADPTHEKDIEWNLVKRLGDGSEREWDFTVNANNEIHFFISGSVGTYIVSASYGGKVGYYSVVVDNSMLGEIYIEHVRGDTIQKYGDEKELVYMVVLPNNIPSSSVVHWMINGQTIESNNVSDKYFFYTPNLGKGTYTVQAKVGTKISEPKYFYVNNNDAPTIVLNGDPIVYVEAKIGVYEEKGAIAYDDLDGEVPVHITGIELVNSNIKDTYYIRYDAVDSHGNNAISVYRQVIVQDTIAPRVTINGDRIIYVQYGEKYVDQGATAIDNYDGPVEVTTSNPVSTIKTGEYEVVYSAYDSSGNKGTDIRIVIVIDNIKPIIELEGNEIHYVEVYHEFVDPGALVTDNVDGTFYIKATSFTCGGKEVSQIDTSILQTCYARYDYTDEGGNTGAGKVRTVIIVDTTPPEIILNGLNRIIVRYAYPNLDFTDPGAVAIDNYDEYVPVTVSGELGRELGTYYLYYDAVDSHGNKAVTVTREVVVVDVENPIISFYARCPQYMTIEALYEEYDTRCDLPGYGIWVEDDYKEDLEGIQKRVVVTGSVDNTTKGLYIIHYDVKDMAGNSAVTLDRYVRVVDTTAPVLSLIGGDENDEQSITVEVFEQFIDLGASAYDRYDEYHDIEITVTTSHNVNINKLGEYIVVYNAKDSSGNKATPITRKVYVKDTKAPVVTIIGPNPYTLERGRKYVEYDASAIDNYNGPLKVLPPINAPSGMSLGTYKVIYRAIDSSGNIGEAIRIVHVVDTIPPTVLGVENGKYYKEPVSIHFIPTPGTDEKLEGWLNGEPITSPHFVDQEGKYNLLVKDDAGNKTEIWFAIDTTPPTIIGVKNGEYTNREVVDITADEELMYYEYRYEMSNWIRVEEQKVSFTKEGTYWIYAVDKAGNRCSTVKFVIDRTLPKYSLIGVLNKGITNTNVQLITEEYATIVVNAKYNIKETHIFDEDGYYQVSIRDLAGNTVILQFVVNKTNRVMVNGEIITILSQHNAIDTIRINGTNYPRSSGYMVVIPLLDGGFQYVSGKLFSEAEYQTLRSGGTVEFGVAPTDDTFMFASFVVGSEDLNKFGTQTVEGDDDDNNALIYLGVFILIALLVGWLFFIFLRRRKEEEDEDEEEIIEDEY